MIELTHTVRLDRQEAHEGVRYEGGIAWLEGDFTLADSFEPDPTLGCCFYAQGQEVRWERFALDTSIREHDSDHELSGLRFQRAGILRGKWTYLRGFSHIGIWTQGIDLVELGPGRVFDCNQPWNFGNATVAHGEHPTDTVRLNGMVCGHTWGPPVYEGVHDPEQASQRGWNQCDRYRGSDSGVSTARLLTAFGCRFFGDCMMGFKFAKGSGMAGLWNCEIGGGIMVDEGTVGLYDCQVHDFASHYSVTEPTTQLLYAIDGGRIHARGCDIVEDPGRTRYAVQAHRKSVVILEQCVRIGDVRVHDSEGGEFIERDRRYRRGRIERV